MPLSLSWNKKNKENKEAKIMLENEMTSNSRTDCTELVNIDSFEGKLFEILSNPNFHLTGSRYFKTARLSSDWDFIVDESYRRITSVLSLAGFVLKPNTSTYNQDPYTVAVYEYVQNGGSIHVQVLKKGCAERKLVIQKLILDNIPRDVLMHLFQYKTYSVSYWKLFTELYETEPIK